MSEEQLKEASAEAQPFVLAVDDEVGVLRLIRLELTAQGFRVKTATNGEDALRIVEEDHPDIVLLDILMAEMSGLEVLTRLRQTSNIPVIFLTAMGRDIEKVRGLDLGADDYLVKPFNPEELSARVRAVLRRTRGHPATANVIRAEGIEIDLDRRIVRKDTKSVQLTRTEWMLLEALSTNPGRVMLNAELLGRVWGPEYRGDHQYLRVWISRIRNKIEADPSNPKIIRTRYGIGYVFEGKDGEEGQENPALAKT